MLNTLQQSTHQTTLKGYVKLIKVGARFIKKHINRNILKIFNNIKELVCIPQFEDNNKRYNNYI